MTTIQKILSADADGSVHVPLPKELRHGKLMVFATIAKVADSSSKPRPFDYLRRIASRGGIRSIPDPMAWQQEVREDRILPGRSE